MTECFYQYKDYGVLFVKWHDGAFRVFLKDMRNTEEESPFICTELSSYSAKEDAQKALNEYAFKNYLYIVGHSLSDVRRSRGAQVWC